MLEADSSADHATAVVPNKADKKLIQPPPNVGRYSHGNGPGPPIQNGPGDQESGPDGANLFIFHIPNWCTNRQIFELFILEECRWFTKNV